MDKQYMLRVLRLRIEEVEKKYRTYFDTDGPSKSKNGAAVIRARCVKELRALRLLEYFIMRCPETLTMDNADLCNAFDKLTEPSKRK